MLDLRVPEAFSASGGKPHDFIIWIGPRLFGYLLTFVVSGTYWLSHHRYFDHIEGFDRGLLGYNLLFLLFVGLLPFSTAALSTSSVSNGTYPFYWAIYAGNLTLAGVMLALTWNYAVSHHLVKAETNRRLIRGISVRQLVTPIAFVVSIAAQYLYPRILLGPYVLLLIPASAWVVDRILPRDHDREGRQRGLREFLWRLGTAILWLLMIGLSIWAMSI